MNETINTNMFTWEYIQNAKWEKQGDMFVQFSLYDYSKYTTYTTNKLPDYYEK